MQEPYARYVHVRPGKKGVEALREPSRGPPLDVADFLSRTGSTGANLVIAGEASRRRARRRGNELGREIYRIGRRAFHTRLAL